jgi:hypothetical protein
MAQVIQNGSGPDNQTTPDRRSLAELEDIVKEGLRTYQEVGAALEEIHERKLYKPAYKNFKTYLQERWGISRAHAYRLMAAVKVAEMSPIGDKPENEHQARKRKSEERSNQVVKLLTENLDPEAQFKTIRLFVSRWEKGMSPENRSQLLERVISHLKNLRAEMEVAA